MQKSRRETYLSYKASVLTVSSSLSFINFLMEYLESHGEVSKADMCTENFKFWKGPTEKQRNRIMISKM